MTHHKWFDKLTMNMINELRENKKMTLEKLADLMQQGFLNVDKKFEGVDKRFEGVDKNFKAVEKNFRDIDKRFNAVERRFGIVDIRFQSMGRRFEGLDVRFDAVVKKFETQEKKFDEKLEDLARMVQGAFQELRVDMHEEFDALDLRLFRETSTAEKDREILDKRLRVVEGK